MIAAFSLPFLLVQKKTEPRVEFSSSRSEIRLWLVTLERKVYVFWMAKDSCRISCIRQWRAHLIWLGCVFMVIPLTLSTLMALPAFRKRLFCSLGPLDSDRKSTGTEFDWTKQNGGSLKTLEPQKLMKRKFYVSTIPGLGCIPSGGSVSIQYL